VERSKTIGSSTYTVRLLAPDVAHDLFLEIMKSVGPALAGGVVDGDLANQDVSKVLKDILDRLDLETVKRARQLIKEVTEVSVNGKMLPLGTIYEIHFRGKLMELSQWLLFGLETQYSDFLDHLGLATDPDDQKKVAGNQSKSRKG